MKKILLSFTIVFALIFTSCDLINPVSTSDNSIVEGLKTALEVGTDSAVFTTSQQDGYLKDELIKIMLPPEAGIIVDNISLVPGGQALLNNVITGINRSAEDAAKSAGPIFRDAITSLSISDGLSILNGQNPASSTKSYAVAFDSTAATQYLKSTTYDQLVTSFSAPINQSLDKPLVLGISTNDAWNNLTSAYNTVVDADVLNIFGLHKVTTDLGTYCTQRALDGLFLKVGDQEIKIRRDPWQWVSTTVGDILTKVFGSKQ